MSTQFIGSGMMYIEACKWYGFAHHTFFMNVTRFIRNPYKI